MAEVTVEIGGRVYRLGCGDGEEPHLESLARRIDAEARHLSRSMGQMTEARLLLMSALMVADRCAEAENQAAAAEGAARVPQSDADAPTRGRKQPGLFDGDLETAVAKAIDVAAARIEALAAAVEAGEAG